MMRQRHWRIAVCTCEMAPANDQRAGAEMAKNQASQMISEMKEFATFAAPEQRYIARALDVAARGTDALPVWSRSPAEGASIRMQGRLYRTLLELIRNSGPLITISAFDLGEGKIERFSAYRFLYER